MLHDVNHLIALLVVFPLAAGIFTMLLRGQIRLQRCVGIAGIVCSLTTAFVLIAGLGGGEGIALSQMGGWRAPFGITVVFDGISGLLLCVAQVVALGCYLASFSLIERRIERGWFHPLFHMLLLGVNFSFLTGDLFNLFVAFEIMLMSSYGLLCLGASRRQLSQAYKYVILNLIGSTVFVLAAGMVYGLMGTLNYADLARMVAEARVSGESLPSGFHAVAFMLLLVFCLKAAVFPLWFWLPDTYHTMPTPITALFAALLSKVGVYAVLRLYPMVFAAPGIGEGGFALTFLAAGAGLTMLIAILGAVASNELRRVLSLILVSHIGYLIFGIVMMTSASLAGTLLYMSQEMLVMSALFLCCGMIESHTGSDDMSKVGGVLKRSPWLGVLFFIAGLGLIGVPPLSGFYGKVILLHEGFARGHFVLSSMLLLAALLTLVAVVKMWAYVFWSPIKGRLLELPKGAEFGPTIPMRGAFAGIGVLIGASLVFGPVSEPIVRFGMQAASGLPRPEGYVTSVLGPGSWPQRSAPPVITASESGADGVILTTVETN